MPGLELRRISFDTLDSTNAEAVRRASAGERGPLWIVAARQTAGRGRQGRQWESRTGNLYATLLITLPVPPNIAVQTSFVASLAVLDLAAGLLAAPERLSLKWPNDVLLDMRKLSGILVETLANDNFGLTTVAIGIGVNLVHAPVRTRYGATSLAEHGIHIDPDEAFPRLAAALGTRLTQWNDGREFAVIRRDWTARAAGLGRRISVTMGERIVIGEFTGLASDGALLLSDAGGQLHTIHAGEVTLALEPAAALSSGAP